MTPVTLTRWSGFAALLGGVLYGAYWVFHPYVPSIIERPADYMWEHVVGLAGQALTLLGLCGVYARRVERTGWLGFAGFVLLFLGVLSFFGVTATDTFVWPALAFNPVGRGLILTTAGEFDQASAVFNANMALVMLGIIGVGLGSVVFGVAAFRAEAGSRWASLLLAVGGPLLAIGPALPMHDAFPVNLLYFAPFAAGLAWLGWLTMRAE